MSETTVYVNLDYSDPQEIDAKAALARAEQGKVVHVVDVDLLDEYKRVASELHEVRRLIAASPRAILGLVTAPGGVADVRVRRRDS